ncbi:A/G-specific adenine glycosylase [Myroides pelagicus]|uniref:Adenine DNA glycosylase n=1 Tax=Myroides pelagicus TaxID=270914 RepID=A0A7K1GI66_9FLAO|nr:A/G-specific adenine glycosylase [Myroides pelagicus]MEC4112807.1 A/G-specific adenine glycosylase [Myroides pelagicus]MTH28617.1 A/G-specific adenine glycosylase [Myroides pelagicus]
MIFYNKLITWYLENKRTLPWRETTDPYAIWLSEIILQQTRVAQGLPYFQAFLTHYPTVFDLANAEEDDVLKLWQGLGYYSRARNLHHTAKTVAYELNGQFPNNYKELLKLKGIGEYTAAAIASIAFGEIVPVVDGNVFRVIARIYGITSDISKGPTKKEFQLKAAELISQETPALFNQAIMDFGAIQCTPKKPLCDTCPFIVNCVAYQTNKIEQLPVKLTKTKVKSRFLNFLVFLDKEKNTYLIKRQEKDIWQKLYQFPVIDHFDKKEINIQTTVDTIYPEISYNQIKQLNEETIIHQLSHQKLHINFWLVDCLSLPAKKEHEKIHWQQINTFAFPIVIHNFINSLAF